MRSTWPGNDLLKRDQRRNAYARKRESIRSTYAVHVIAVIYLGQGNASVNARSTDTLALLCKSTGCASNQATTKRTC